MDPLRAHEALHGLSRMTGGKSRRRHFSAGPPRVDAFRALRQATERRVPGEDRRSVVGAVQPVAVRWGRPPSGLRERCDQAEVLDEGIKVPIAVEQRQPIFDAARGDEGVDGLADSNAELT